MGDSLQIGDLVRHVEQPDLDYRKIIGLPSAGTVWLDFQQRQLDRGDLPTMLPSKNYKKVEVE